MFMEFIAIVSFGNKYTNTSFWNNIGMTPIRLLLGTQIKLLAIKKWNINISSVISW